MEDVSFMLNNFKFNYRVATIIKHDDKILLHKNVNDIFYALPGGRIKIGEDSKTALAREFNEEMNVNINIKKMISVVENFFNYDNKEYHEVMLVYESEFVDSNLYSKDIIKGIEKEGELYFVWKKITELTNLDVRPIIIKKIICNKLENSKNSAVLNNYIVNDFQQ